ncbi:protein LYK5-like [Nymphaea colorata]|nr:protein LYK5-like [Nymphaea colorata]
MVSIRASSSFLCFLSCTLLSLLLPSFLHAQQVYVNNTQFQCYVNHSNTLGFLCNGQQTKCNSYLIFRSDSKINSVPDISFLLNADSAEVARINNASVFQTFPIGREVVVPVSCSCSGKYYQYNSSYVLEPDDTYLRIANDTYQALTTCQALIAQNPYSSTNLPIRSKVMVPLMCACPTRNQTRNGVKFLLTYPIAEGEYASKIAAKFGVDEQGILDANEITEDTTIYFFTPLLIPFKSEPPSWSQILNPSPPSSPPLPSPSPSPPSPVGEGHKKWVFVGVGIGLGLGFLLLAVISSLLVVCLRRRRRRRGEGLAPASPTQKRQKLTESSVSYGDMSGKKSSTVISENLLDAVRSLTVYKYEELQRATDGFSEDSLIKGSVYRAVINGDQAAVKSMKGDVPNEIKVLKQINHSNVIRLSGFCIHEGNTFLVYEFAENGSLSDWIHGHRYQDDQSWSKSTCSLSWKQRMQIAFDVADGLSYLHNYTSPAHVHKNLKSSNILLDDKFRAKIANFGLARAVGDQEDGLHLTRHVFGTQGYMAPEYLEHGLITWKLDVFAFGVVLLELLSGREAVDQAHVQYKGEVLLSSAIGPILEGDDAKEKLRSFIDPSLGSDYPLDLALVIARLASECVADDMNSRPSMTDVLMTLSASTGWSSSSASTYESAVLKR